eukprot:CAMPEP_0181079874 /NCGR_PEP_ID=MMETSP1071-20121207/2261_1 /TAXON_ID=35127 /ORGANISM="Thalassiosira sp., Strain NH16" /LENGTH=162 /DNA_ID=CAMNT_0023161303 /DNA_START=217 /DNA_END=701 /DNA_ORIENTATION=+
MWDDRARCLLESLSRMGHEDEDYASVPMATSMRKDALERARARREESSIGLAKLRKKEEEEEEDGEDGGVKKEEGEKPEEEDTEDDEKESERHKLKVKHTKVLKTYEQRRKFLVKAMDMHRHTIGGGRSGRRGRAECVAFFRHVLEMLDDQYEQALEAEGGS